MRSARPDLELFRDDKTRRELARRLSAEGVNADRCIDL